MFRRRAPTSSVPISRIIFLEKGVKMILQTTLMYNPTRIDSLSSSIFQIEGIEDFNEYNVAAALVLFDKVNTWGIPLKTAVTETVDLMIQHPPKRGDKIKAEKNPRYVSQIAEDDMRRILYTTNIYPIYILIDRQLRNI